MVEPLRHRQTKGAATDMFYLTPPRHISTLRKADIHKDRQLAGSADSRSSSEAFAIAEPNCDPVTKCIQKIVLYLFVFVSNSKTLDLLDKVVP